MRAANVRAVLFDFGGVFTLSPFEALRQATGSLEVDAEEALTIIFGPYDLDTDHPWHRVERGEMDLKSYRAEVELELASRGLDLDPFQILAKLGSGGTGGRTIRDDVVDVVRRVRSSGRLTALVTNNALELRELWRPLLPLDELFDTVIDSCEVGVRKPDPQIFELALAQLGGVDPSDSVFLDDHPGNVAAASRLGMRAILVEPDHKPAMAELQRLLAEGPPET